MKNNILIHIPHSSFNIPDKYKNLFYLTKEKLFKEQIKMSDSYTNELFGMSGFAKLIFPLSRLVCDVERFRREEDEEMTKQGMWVCYTKTSDQKPLKQVDFVHKQEILNKYYDKHHKLFTQKTDEIVENFGECLIIDAHSFSSEPLPYELHSQSTRPDICIGTDVYHTPKALADYFCSEFSRLGYNVAVNNPFCGTIVPLKHYGISKNVKSVMLEINRNLYMNEETGEKNDNFLKIKNDIQKVIKLCSAEIFKIDKN